MDYLKGYKQIKREREAKQILVDYLHALPIAALLLTIFVVLFWLASTIVTFVL